MCSRAFRGALACGAQVKLRGMKPAALVTADTLETARPQHSSLSVQVRK